MTTICQFSAHIHQTTQCSGIWRCATARYTRCDAMTHLNYVTIQYTWSPLKEPWPVSDGNTPCRLGGARHSWNASCLAGPGCISSYRPTQQSMCQKHIYLYLVWRPKFNAVFQWRDPSNFAWGPWKFKWWGPRTLNKKCLSKALGRKKSASTLSRWVKMPFGWVKNALYNYVMYKKIVKIYIRMSW